MGDPREHSYLHLGGGTEPTMFVVPLVAGISL